MNLSCTRFTTLMIAILLACSASAVTVVECVDANGDASFRERCPPGTVKKGEKKLLGVGASSRPSAAEVAKTHPVTLYTVPQCDPCDLVRNQLDKRKVPYTEKDVAENVELQIELMDAAGSVTVPTVLVGDEVFKGYDRAALEAGLTEAGYP
jgi:glutaredoxin